MDAAGVVAIDIDSTAAGLDIVDADLIYGDYWWPREESTNTPGTVYHDITELPAWIVNEADSHYGESFGEIAGRYWGSRYFDRYLYDIDYDVSIVLADSFASTTAANYTNIQVEGVDEADLIESDGQFLYIVAGWRTRNRRRWRCGPCNRFAYPDRR